MRQVHVITAFSRIHLLDVLIHTYQPMGIIWHPVIFDNELIEWPDKEWIDPFIIPFDEGVKNFIDIGYHKKMHFFTAGHWLTMTIISFLMMMT